MNQKSKVKVNKQDKFLTKFEDNNGNKYDFKVEEGDVNFDKLEKDSKPTSKTFKLKAKKSDAKDEPSNWKDVTDTEVIYKENWWRKGCYIKGKKIKIDGSEVEFKSEIDERLNTEIHSVTLVSYLLGGILLAALAFAGYYFFSSKEDKEEESL